MKDDNTRQEISEITGFDSGAKFTTPEQVRGYFDCNRLMDCVSMAEPPILMPSQDTLNEWAELVIANKWHCDFDDAPAIAAEPRELILALCREAGDDMSDPESVIGDFLANHTPETAEDVIAAAGGDAAALVRVRTACGLPIVS